MEIKIPFSAFCSLFNTCINAAEVTVGLDFLVWAAASHLVKEQFENMVKTNHLEK